MKQQTSGPRSRSVRVEGDGTGAKAAGRVPANDSEPGNARILVADDREQDLRAYRATLLAAGDPDDPTSAVRALESLLFGDEEETVASATLAGWACDLTLCRQAEEAVQAVDAASAAQRGYAAAFLDVHMPPGPDGLWAAAQIRAADPDVSIVMVTAYTDLDAQELARRVPPADRLFYIQKPFHPQELLQLVLALTARWRAETLLKQDQAELESIVAARTTELGLANLALRAEVAERQSVEDTLRASEQQLRASLAAREVLLREIHHRVKNNLQVIISLLRLQSRRFDDQASCDALEESQGRIQAMALVHETLYQSDNLQGIEFGKYAKRLTNQLLRSHGALTRGIRVCVAGGNQVLEIDVAVNCALIVNELVTNALKHAFPGGRQGEIVVGLAPDGQDQVTLSVTDDGVGLPTGLDFRSAKGLGLHLVTILVEDQLHGQIEVDGAQGTAVHIRFRVDTP